MAIEIRVLGPGDAPILDRVAPSVFDNEIDPDLTREFLHDSRHHLVVAMDGDMVVGMASAVDYLHPDKPRELWINEVGVAPNYRRSGIGKRLLRALFAQGRERGCREAWLGTEPDNQAARALYKSVKGRKASFLLFSFRLEE